MPIVTSCVLTQQCGCPCVHVRAGRLVERCLGLDSVAEYSGILSFLFAVHD